MTEKERDPRSQNAMKGAVQATAQIHMRVTPERKNRYVIQAQEEGLKLTEWMQKRLDEICEKAPPSCKKEDI